MIAVEELKALPIIDVNLYAIALRHAEQLDAANAEIERLRDVCATDIKVISDIGNRCKIERERAERAEAEIERLRAELATARNDALEEACNCALIERALWKSTKTPVPDDVEGGRSASNNIAIAIRALKREGGGNG